MWKASFIIIFIFSILRISASQKITGTVSPTGENSTIYVSFSTKGDETGHSLICAPDWASTIKPKLTWEITAPMASEGIDYIKQNGTITTGVLWLTFLNVNSNTTGTYACVAESLNGTSYTNFVVSVGSGLSIAGIVGIAVASIVLAGAAVYLVLRGAKRLGYISM